MLHEVIVAEMQSREGVARLDAAIGNALLAWSLAPMMERFLLKFRFTARVPRFGVGPRRHGNSIPAFGYRTESTHQWFVAEERRQGLVVGQLGSGIT